MLRFAFLGDTFLCPRSDSRTAAQFRHMSRPLYYTFYSCNWTVAVQAERHKDHESSANKLSCNNEMFVVEHVLGPTYNKLPVL